MMKKDNGFRPVKIPKTLFVFSIIVWAIVGIILACILNSPYLYGGIEIALIIIFLSSFYKDRKKVRVKGDILVSSDTYGWFFITTIIVPIIFLIVILFFKL